MPGSTVAELRVALLDLDTRLNRVLSLLRYGVHGILTLVIVVLLVQVNIWVRDILQNRVVHRVQLTQGTEVVLMPVRIGLNGVRVTLGVGVDLLWRSLVRNRLTLFVPAGMVLFQQWRLPGYLTVVKIVLLRQVVVKLRILIIVVALRAD